MTKNRHPPALLLQWEEGRGRATLLPWDLPDDEGGETVKRLSEIVQELELERKQ